MRSRGFTTIEALVALAILVTALVSLGQVVVGATRATVVSAATSTAVLLAVDKMEQLRAMAWTVDAIGRPVSDAGLAPSPVDALDRDAAGYADAPEGYVRRWSIRPLPGLPDTLALQVRVIARTGADVRLATVRTRRGD